MDIISDLSDWRNQESLCWLPIFFSDESSFIKTFYFHFLGPLIIFTTLNVFPKTLVEIGFINIFSFPTIFFCKYIFFFHLLRCVIKHVKVHISLDISLERAGYLYLYLHIISVVLKTTRNRKQTYDHFKLFNLIFPSVLSRAIPQIFIQKKRRSKF